MLRGPSIPLAAAALVQLTAAGLAPLAADLAWTSGKPAGAVIGTSGGTSSEPAGAVIEAAGGTSSEPAGAVIEAAGGRVGAVRARAEVLRPDAPLTVGDPLTVVVRIDGDPEATPVEPRVGETELQPFRLLGSERVDRTLRLHLAPLAVGSLSIPSIEVLFRDHSGKEGTARTDPIPLEVVSVLEGGRVELADIKPPAEVRPDWRRLLPWAVWGLLGATALAGAAALWRRWKRRPALSPGLDPLQGRDATEWATEALARLMAAGHLEEQSIKPFCFELSAIVRQYLEYRYWIPAPERTTDEIAGELARALIPEDVRGSLVPLLRRCDEVKFAGRWADPSECRQAAGDFAALIERTRPHRDSVRTASTPATAS